MPTLIALVIDAVSLTIAGSAYGYLLGSMGIAGKKSKS